MKKWPHNPISVDEVPHQCEVTYTQTNLFKILLNQPEIGLYLPFSDWFLYKRTSVCVPNQSVHGIYKLISGWFHKIWKRFLCVYASLQLWGILAPSHFRLGWICVHPLDDWCIADEYIYTYLYIYVFILIVSCTSTGSCRHTVCTLTVIHDNSQTL